MGGWDVISPLYFLCFTFSDGLWTKYIHQRALWDKYCNVILPHIIPLVEFKHKHTEIPILENYKGVLSDEYLAHWTKITLEHALPFKSWVSPGMLLRLANELGYKDRTRLGWVIERLRNGADLGCQGSTRLPTRMFNGCSAFKYGDRLADTL